MFYFSVKYFLYYIALVIASIIHLRTAKPRDHFLLRILLSFLVTAGVALALPNISDSGIIPVIYDTAIRFFLFGLLLMASIVCFNTKAIYLITKCIFGSLTVFISYIVSYIAGIVFDINNETVSLAIYIGIYVITCLIFAFFSLRQDKGRYFRFNNISLTFFLIFCICVIMSFVESDFKDISPEIIFPIFLLIVAFLTFIILNICADERRLKIENDFLKIIRQKENKQYQTIKELMDDINVKCHDLKHQINNIKINGIKNNSYLEEVENNISAFQNIVTTENNALNVLFFEKQKSIREGKIKLITHLDCSKLSFLKEEDIYSLFGNILDNAIESTVNVPLEKRIIQLTISSNSFAIYINCKNPYQGEIAFQNGLPISKKQNSIYHGFGTKSIKKTIKKYGGILEFSTKDEVFEIQIMIPF